VRVCLTGWAGTPPPSSNASSPAERLRPSPPVAGHRFSPYHRRLGDACSFTASRARCNGEVMLSARAVAHEWRSFWRAQAR